MTQTLRKTLFEEYLLLLKNRDALTYLETTDLFHEFQKETNSLPPLKIAVLSNFTIRPMEIPLSLACRLAGFNPTIYFGPYNQVHKEILDPSSELYAFSPEIVFLALDGQTILPKSFEWSLKTTVLEKEKECQEAVKDVGQLVEVLVQKTRSLILVSNFRLPFPLSLGILDNKSSGQVELIQKTNQQLAKTFSNVKNVFVLDTEYAASVFGRERAFDPRLYYRGDIRWSYDFMVFIANQLNRYVRAFKGTTKKCVVLDLDNVLWGGVIGEDGLEHIKLSKTSAGKEFFEFQQFLKQLTERGILLAINSKNNPEDVEEVFQKHSDMVLQKSDFASIRINWTDKAQNLQSIADELNIGLDSMVFVDDNPIERGLVATMLPQVTVPEMPEDPKEYRLFLSKQPFFEKIAITKEDLEKKEMYQKQRQRTEFKEQAGSLEAYLKGLKQEITVFSAKPENLDRITQLVHKTNQFNLTTKRYTVAEIENMQKNSKWNILAIRVKDRFGDNGIVGVLILDKTNPNEWNIDSFLLSCRVLGRKVEYALLQYVLENAKRQKAAMVRGRYLRTEKNQVSKDLFLNAGFSNEKTTSKGDSHWFFSLGKNEFKQAIPGKIKIVS